MLCYYHRMHCEPGWLTVVSLEKIVDVYAHDSRQFISCILAEMMYQRQEFSTCFASSGLYLWSCCCMHPAAEILAATKRKRVKMYLNINLGWLSELLWLVWDAGLLPVVKHSCSSNACSLVLSLMLELCSQLEVNMFPWRAGFTIETNPVGLAANTTPCGIL